MDGIRSDLERHQVGIYLAATSMASIAAFTLPDTTALEVAVNPALALMLFVTFLQVPLAELGQAFVRVRFLLALLLANFVVVPVLVAGLIQLVPDDPMIRLGVLLILLTPCIDYVVTFSHLGRADAQLLLAATPMLLVAQMALLPIYLTLFLGVDAAALVRVGPFLHAFAWLIAIPLLLAAAVQISRGRSPFAGRISAGLSLFPVPATALVLFVVIAAVMPRLGSAFADALSVVPVYLASAVAAPFLGWGAGRLFRLDPLTGRALAFSAATRNSLVVLPLAFAVPGAVPILRAVIVTQTLIELMNELVYVRLLPRLGAPRPSRLPTG